MKYSTKGAALRKEPHNVSFFQTLRKIENQFYHGLINSQNPSTNLFPYIGESLFISLLKTFNTTFILIT